MATPLTFVLARPTARPAQGGFRQTESDARAGERELDAGGQRNVEVEVVVNGLDLRPRCGWRPGGGRARRESRARVIKGVGARLVAVRSQAMSDLEKRGRRVTPSSDLPALSSAAAWK